MAGVCDYRERRTRLLFTIFRFCFSGSRFLGRRRCRRRARRKLLAQREQRFSSSSKHCVWYLTTFFLKGGCPLSRISLSLPRGKKKDSRKMTILAPLKLPLLLPKIKNVVFLFVVFSFCKKVFVLTNFILLEREMP